MEADGVFEGGGVKGIGLVGALSRLEEEGVRFRRVAGTSAGAITAALCAAGYTAGEMKEILWRKDFNEFADARPLLEGPLYRNLWKKAVMVLPALFEWGQYGIFPTGPFHGWVKGLLERKGVRRFKDCRTFLRVFASDITQQRLLVFDGRQTPEMEVAEAVRMSMTIPLFFKANRWKRQGGASWVVDGGLLANYPIDTFDDDREHATIGLKLISEGELESPKPARSFVAFLTQTINTMQTAHERIHVEEAYWAKTVPILTGKVPTTKFDLTEEEKTFLYSSGREAADQAIREGLLKPEGRKGLLK